MKVLIDTNVFLSYLLASVTPRTVTTVVQTCLNHNEIDLLVPHEQIAELTGTANTKTYFRLRLSGSALQDLIQQLTTYAQLPPPLEEIATYSRDPKDDYLVAYGVVNEAEYLITGDSDLLTLGSVGSLQVVNPSQFIDVLQAHHFLP